VRSSSVLWIGWAHRLPCFDDLVRIDRETHANLNRLAALRRGPKFPMNQRLLDSVKEFIGGFGHIELDYACARNIAIGIDKKIEYAYPAGVPLWVVAR